MARFLDEIRPKSKFGISQLLHKIKNIFDDTDYRGRPGVEIQQNGKTIVVPTRVQKNNSPTKRNSQRFENRMAIALGINGEREPKSDKVYDVPFIKEKSFILDGHTTSENILDSIVKYTAIHNSNPVVTKQHSGLAKTRPVDAREAIGLLFESKAGAIPFYNFVNPPKEATTKEKEKIKERNRTLANANYFTAFGNIPAEALVRNWHYASELEKDSNVEPLLDAIRYYAQGDYNRGLGKNVHTKRTQAAANNYLQNTNVVNTLNRLKFEYPAAFIE